MLPGKETKSCNKHNTVVESLSNDSSVKMTFAVKGKKFFSTLKPVLTTIYSHRTSQGKDKQRRRKVGGGEAKFHFPKTNK